MLTLDSPKMDTPNMDTPNINAPYEVEIRFQAENEAEAHDLLPFLRDSMSYQVDWRTATYGREIYDSGKLLRLSRIADVSRPKIRPDRYYLGYKGNDQGSTANIRQELEEEVTSGISNSAIMDILGGKQNLKTSEEVKAELEQLGQNEFMTFHGRNTYGRYVPMNLDIKFMPCPEIEYPFLVELEKSADTLPEALKKERELVDLAEKYHLTDRLIYDEPPTLLFKALGLK